MAAPSLATTGVLQRRLYLGCAVYVSEARDAAALRHLQAAARHAAAAASASHGSSGGGACLANLFVDEPYNRSNFTLVGSSVPALAAAAASLARTALQMLDLRCHDASHPRLGTVDHISCHPLPSALDIAAVHLDGSGSSDSSSNAGPGNAEAAAEVQQQQQQQQQGQQAAAALAQAIAQQLGCGPHAVPVLTYGWAHPQQRPLDALRRQLGYFRGAAASSWKGGLQPLHRSPAVGLATAGQQKLALQLLLPLAPCYGPPTAPVHSGVCCVGAVPWVVNYNVLLYTDDMTAARAIARAVSERGGGLLAVQAMALRHTDGIEVACNLLDTSATSPAAVLKKVQQLAAQAGVAVGPAYRTNKAPEELVAAALAAGI